jgi:YidC/Oxa1 family membrane protein insertase
MDKNFIFAILLTTVIVVFFSSPLYQKKFGKEIPVSQQTQTLKKSDSQSGLSPSSQIDKPAPTTVDSIPQTITEASVSVTASDSASVKALPPNTQIDKPLQEENIVLKNDNLNVTIITAGGSITNVSLSKYTGPEKNTTPQLVTDGQSWYGGYIVDDGKEILLKDLIFNIVEKTDKKNNSSCYSCRWQNHYTHFVP